jgi:glycosyltransferase involved in cell wall biosynthesis/GT2 family glycosyltransferase
MLSINPNKHGPALPATEKIIASILVPIQGEWQELPPGVQALFDVRDSSPNLNIEIVLIPIQLSSRQTARLRDMSYSLRNTRVVTSDVSEKFVHALNQAAQTARGRWLIFLRSECCPKTGWLSELLKAANQAPTGILSAKSLYPPAESNNIERVHNCGIAFDIHNRPRLLYQYCLARQPFTSHVRELQAILSPLMLIDRELFNAMGGFDEMLPGRGMIFDLCFRVRQAGFSIRLAPACEVYTHLSAGVQDPWVDTSNDDAFIRKWSSQIQADEINHFRRDGLALAPDGSQRIAMVTPLAPQKTGVADYVQELIPSLAQLATLDLFVAGYIPTEFSLLSQYCVRFISDLETCHHAQPYDQIVYHIGNNSFHTAIYDAATRVGGVMVVHEYDSIGCKTGSDYTPPSTLEELRQDFDEGLYLSKNLDVAAEVQSEIFSSAWEHFAQFGYREKRPFSRKQLGVITNKALWQKLFAHAAGVIVHNRHSQTLLQAEFPELPIAVISHLLSPKAVERGLSDDSDARRRLNLPEHTFVVVSLGLIQPHKRNHITVQAFAHFVHQRPDSLLVLAGDSPEAGYRAYLEDLIQKLGVQDRVRFTGWLLEEEFFDWISAGDVLVNLRYPSRGEESGTLIRILGTGKATIVSDYAQYADIPDECVIKIPFVDEIHKLADEFSKLADNDTLRHELADHARLHFRTHNSVERVAEAYAAFCRSVQAKPWSWAYDYSEETHASVLWEMPGREVNYPARELALALDRVGVPIRVKPLTLFDNSFGLTSMETNRLRKMETLPLAERFLQIYAGPVLRFQRHPEAAYAIVITDHFDQPLTKWEAVPADEFWVPSTHSREQLIQDGVPVEKIYLIPFGVSALAYGTTICQHRLNGTFTFLTMVDWNERRGWQALLYAFLQEFKGRRDVQLRFWLLPDISNADGHQAAMHHLSRFAQLHPEFRKEQYDQVSVETRLIAQDEIPLIYASVDAYILPYSDSAFGRTLLEAMAIGLPVITSTFGGQCDFVSNTNAFLLTGKPGTTEIDNQSLRARMREVVDHRLDAQARGIYARNFVLQSWTWEHAAAHALRRMEAANGAPLIQRHIPHKTQSPIPAIVNLIKPTQPAHPYGFNIIGYISGNLGIGVTARNVTRLLLDNGYPVKLMDLDPGIGRSGHDLSFRHYTVSSAEELTHPINLFVLPPNELMKLFKNAQSRWLSPEHLNVAWSMWELPVLPPAWREQLQALDVLIAESQFIRQLFSCSLSGIPMVTAMHPLYLPAGIAEQRVRFGLPEDVVLFITSFEPYSDIQRKNPMAVLEAFQRAFNQSPRAHLVIKINNPGIGSELHPFVQQLQQRYGGYRQIHVLAETLSYEDVLSLYASCDVYVSLHRAEGLGLGLMEAMTLGKPVIATAWSGNMTFMNYTNSCPVNYHLIPVDTSTPIYRKETLGMKTIWADPDIDEAAAWMLRLAEDPDLRAEIGRKAADDMRRWQDEARHGKFIDELQAIWEHHSFQHAESVFHRFGGGWVITGRQLFSSAGKKSTGRVNQAYRRGELALRRQWSVWRAVGSRLFHRAQKTKIGRWIFMRIRPW